MDLVGELPVDDVLGGGRRQAGDLGAQLVDATAGEGGDVGLGLGLEIGDLGLEPGGAVAQQRRRLLVGVGQHPGAFGLEVAERAADLCGFGVGGGRVGGGVVELSLHACGAVPGTP